MYIIASDRDLPFVPKESDNSTAILIRYRLRSESGRAKLIDRPASLDCFHIHLRIN